MTMLIMGYKGKPDWTKIRASFKRCTDLQTHDIEKIVKNVKDGKTETIPNDHTLYDDLKELGILIK